MDFPITLVDLAGCVALLLWGVHMVQTGVQRAFGAKLRSFLGGALRSRGKAFLAGMGVTALLQSSTATGPRVTGFAAGGLVERLVAEKEALRAMEAEATAAHLARLRSGRPDTAQTSSLHLDALRDLKTVNAHLVASAAYPVLEGKGELLPSRLRQDDWSVLEADERRGP